MGAVHYRVLRVHRHSAMGDSVTEEAMKYLPTLIGVVLFSASLMAQSQSPRAAGAGASEPIAKGQPTYRPSTSSDSSGYRFQPKPKKQKAVSILDVLFRPRFTPEEVRCLLWNDCIDLDFYRR